MLETAAFMFFVALFCFGVFAIARYLGPMAASLLLLVTSCSM